jgi:hypothetical protein
MTFFLKLTGVRQIHNKYPKEIYIEELARVARPAEHFLEI